MCKRFTVELLTETAKTLRVKSAIKFMKFGDVTHPTLYNSDVLKKAEAQDRKYGFRNEDPIKELHI